MDAVIADSKGQANVLYLGVTDSPQTLDAANYGKRSRKPNSPLETAPAARPIFVFFSFHQHVWKGFKCNAPGLARAGL